MIMCACVHITGCSVVCSAVLLACHKLRCSSARAEVVTRQQALCAPVRTLVRFASAFVRGALSGRLIEAPVILLKKKWRVVLSFTVGAVWRMSGREAHVSPLVVRAAQCN